MKKSTKGSIRKAPSSVSWVFSFSNLAATNRNFDSNQMIKLWNLGIHHFNFMLVLAQKLFEIEGDYVNHLGLRTQSPHTK